MAAMRAGVNHWQAGLIEVGHGMVCKAYAILLVTHGPTHPITKDLEVKRSITSTPEVCTAQTVAVAATFGIKHANIWSICIRTISCAAAFTGDADADGDGAQDVQAERICLPQHERRCPAEQTDDHDARTKGRGGGNQEPLPSAEIVTEPQSVVLLNSLGFWFL